MSDNIEPLVTELRQLAEPVKEWGLDCQAWQDPEDEFIALFGSVDESGEKFELGSACADLYGTEGESLKLAQFYAACSPALVLMLLDRIPAHAFLVTGEDEDCLVALGAKTPAQFRAAVAAAGLVRAHAGEEGREHLEPLQAWVLKNEEGAWVLDASEGTPGAQPAMVALAFWAKTYEFAQ